MQKIPHADVNKRATPFGLLFWRSDVAAAATAAAADAAPAAVQTTYKKKKQETESEILVRSE